MSITIDDGSTGRAGEGAGSMGASVGTPSSTGTGGWWGKSAVGIEGDSFEGCGVEALSSLSEGVIIGSEDVVAPSEAVQRLKVQ